MAINGVLAAFPNDDARNYKKLQLRPFIKDFFLAIFEMYEIVIYSDLSEEMTNYVIRAIEEKVKKRVFSYALYEDHCIMNYKTGRLTKDLTLLLNRRSM